MSGSAPANESKGSLAPVLVPIAGVALIVILVVVIGATSDSVQSTAPGKDGETGGSAPFSEKLTDGTDPNANDSGLKDIGEGLMVRDLKDGSGPECPPGARVRVHYTGWLTTGKIFDSSRRRGEPISFSLNGVIAGWTRGIPGMKVGGIRKLVIPAELGYGSRGMGADIPPNSTLVFEVELLGINQR